MNAFLKLLYVYFHICVSGDLSSNDQVNDRGRQAIGECIVANSFVVAPLQAKRAAGRSTKENRLNGKNNKHTNSESNDGSSQKGSPREHQGHFVDQGEKVGTKARARSGQADPSYRKQTTLEADPRGGAVVPLTCNFYFPRGNEDVMCRSLDWASINYSSTAYFHGRERLIKNI